MSTHLLLEAAVRSLVMGAIIYLALRLLRIEQIRARRTAWLLALAGALAMPVLVAAQIGPRLLPEAALAALPARALSFTAARPAAASQAATLAGAAMAATAAAAAGTPATATGPVDAPTGSAAASRTPPLESASANAFRADGGHGAQQVPAPESALVQTEEGAQVAQFGDTVMTLGNMAMTLTVFGYCFVAALLTLRLCTGVGFAIRLRNRAKRVVFAFDPDLDVRTSQRLSTPVTIGSSVLLPHSYTVWDGATLRIVLSHERAHVHQKDFYVHVLAGLHCALFWFNPFSWWLQRQLSELGEALSDRAAVEHAESRTSYAETLLAFATRARWPMTGVAMAAASNLTPRIERLLSDRRFERSFAPKQRLPFVAAAIVALALVASTSMVRVHAAIETSNTAAAIAAIDTATSLDVAPSFNTAASFGMAASSNTATSAQATPGAPTTPSTTSPAVGAAATGTVSSSTQTGTQASTQTSTDKGAIKKTVRVRKFSNRDFDSKSDADEFDTIVNRDEGGGFEDEEGVVAIHSGHSRFMFDSGDLLPRKKGDYIYFQHDGKPYLIQDPEILGKAQQMLEPMKALSEKQKELGEQQRALGAQQGRLASRRYTFKFIQSPEFKREMEDLQKKFIELDLPRLTAQIDEDVLAEVQAHLGEIQARVGELQSEFGREQGNFGEEQGKLGEQQGKLGEQQALLGEQQRKLVEDVRRRLKPIIEQAIRDGKGKLLENE